MNTPDLAHAQWRKSSYSGGNGGSCVEVAELDDNTIAVRNSNHPDAGTLLLTRAQFTAWTASIKTGDQDDLW